MGRKLFLRHLGVVAASPPPEISNVHSPDEGIVAFTFSYARNGQPRSCKLKLLAMDTDEYPDGNTYMLFTDDDSADTVITSRLEIINAVLVGKPLTEALTEVSQSLRVATTRGQANDPITFAESEDDEEEQDDEDSDDDLGEYDIDDADFGFDLSTKHKDGTTSRPALASRPRPSTGTAVDVQKIKTDLKAAKEAGFRVGVYGNLISGGIVCISIRVTKLGISEEAMQAWGLRRSHYFILMIRFAHGYCELSSLRESTTLSGGIEARVALCEHYKPSRQDALTAFGQNSTIQQSTEVDASKRLEQLFIAHPLDELMRDQFPSIVNFRESYSYNWPSAEAFVKEVQGKATSAVEQINPDDFVLEDDTNSKALPDIVKADALDNKLLKDVSLPLAAMQFALRHFVRCTEFCLVCHRRLEDTFEALKPYVCSNPLCLFQYMTLGFGPRIEWEILSQPHVVDLLVSFCYSAALQGRLKEFPVGIDLKVPRLPRYGRTLAYNRHFYGHIPTAVDSGSCGTPSFTAKMDFDELELLLEPEQKSKASSLRVGDWLVICYGSDKLELHYRVVDAMFPTYRLSGPITTESPLYLDNNRQSNAKVPKPDAPMPKGLKLVNCHTYDWLFDGLDSNEQHHAILLLLETLPTVKDMKDFLEKRSGQDATLKAWRNEISDSALNLLRWIIASNRSCIMQVDRLSLVDAVDSKIVSGSNDRVMGMDDWIQFRFAQGAPDKEQRFVDSVKKETGNMKHPTFFAWHGSPIGNWHSIIRQGLRYDETLHGRAFGNGVYMSSMATTSMGYSNMGYTGSITWPKSALEISNALSLQEVINKPDQFVSKSPHYVVADIDWIQTRYLFVKGKAKPSWTTDDQLFVEYAQDNKMLANNEGGKAIQIPITAISKSRRPVVSSITTTNGSKKAKSTTTIDQATAEQIEDDANSIVSDMDDLAWLSSSDSSGAESDDIFYDDEGYLSFAEDRTPTTTTNSSRSSTKKLDLDTSLTDFRPGTLDVSNFKFLPPPANATTSANKALMSWFRDAKKTQESTAIHELGWYINTDHIENMYQWIVELHSFPAHLPIAKDMKKAGITSIVLEMRFTKEFPYSPPFIRVVKPRFLPFNQGGGGHVTEGGAICMELLTNSGWSAVTSLEAVLLQVQLAIGDEERPARLLGSQIKNRPDCYSVCEAVAAYERACRAHGWQVPEGFSVFASTG